MRKIKKLALAFVCLALLTASVCQMAYAAEDSVQASLYLAGYAAHLSPSGPAGSGKLDIDFDVTATEISDLVGVYEIEIYRSNGSYVTTINGSVKNGLLTEDDLTHLGTYTYTGSSGKSYYAIVVMYAERDGGSDSRRYKTNIATAP